MWDDYGVIRPGRMPLDVYENGQIVFTQNSIAFDAPIGTIVGTISVINATPPYKLSVGSNPYYAISGSNLVTKVALVGGVSFVQLFAFKGFKRIAQAVRVFVSGSAAPNPPPVGVFRLGLNVSGMEDNVGVPSATSLAYIKAQGINVIRLPTAWSQMQTTPGGPLVWGTIFDSQTNATIAYNTALSLVLARAAAVGLTVMVDFHNFGGDMHGVKIGQSGAATPAQYADFWQKLVTFLMADLNYSAVDSIDIMNEWSNMDYTQAQPNPVQSTSISQALILSCNTLAKAAIRATGYQKRIYYEWDHFSGFWDAIANNVGQLMDLAVSDIDGVVQLHGYLDRDASGRFYVWSVESTTPGTAPPGINTNVNIGIQRMLAVVALAQSKSCRLCHGEWGVSNDALTAGGNDDYINWNQAATNLLAYCQTNGVESFPFAGGPGFGTNYPYDPEPSNVSNPAIKDFTAAGLSPTQMVVFHQFNGFCGAQPLAYRADLPFNVTPYVASGSALPNFKIRYNGVIPATITFTGHAKLSDGTDIGGTFSPITIPPGNNGIATFSYTPSGSYASINLTFTNDKGLTNPPLPIGVSSQQDFFNQNIGAVAPNIYSLRRLNNTYVGPVVRLLRASDNTQMDFYFNNRGDLPRQAIQDWASSRTIQLITWYDQSGNSNNAAFGSTNINLLLVDSDGYPSIVISGGGVPPSTISTPSVGQGLMSVYLETNPTNSGDIVTQDYYAANFRLAPGSFEVGPNDGVHVYPVTLGLTSSVWSNSIVTYSNLYGSNNLKAYIAGSLVHQATAGQFNNASVFNACTLFNFAFGDQHFSGSMRTLFMQYLEYSSSNASTLNTNSSTYFSTALPDTLTGSAPLIAGAAPRPMITGKTCTPFSGISISDINTSPMDNVTITLSGTGAGTLTGTGLSGSGPYTLSADTPANITTKVQALIYTPTGSAGTSETFTVVVANAAAGTSATNTATVVTINAIAGAETAFTAPTGTFTPVNLKGVNISGGEKSYPETDSRGFDYAYPLNAEIDYYASKGMGVLRVPLFQLRLQPQAYGPFDPIGRTDEYPSSTFGSAYPQTVKNNLIDIKRVIDRARTNNMYIILDLHDFGGITDPANNIVRNVGTDSEGRLIHADCLVRLVTLFKNYDNVIIDPMNEPVGMTAAQWITAANSALAAIAAVTPTSKKVWLCGGGNFSGAHDWVSSGVSTSWASLSIPSGWSVIAQPHQYLDSDDSGTHSTVVSGKGSTVLSAFTTWARSNSVTAALGEFGWNANDSQGSGGVPSVEGSALLSYMSSNSDVWVGWTYWVGGSSLFYSNAYVTGSVPAGYPSGPFTDAPQMSIMVANLASAISPTITGFAASTLTGGTSNPFSSITIGDANSGAHDTVTITLSGATATLTGTGLSGSNPYTLGSDTPANITTKLRALTLNTSATSGTINIALNIASSAGTSASGSAPVTITSSAWDPAQLGSALVAWWDASDTAHMTFSGSNVLTWTDKIGGVVATSSASKPTYSATARNGSSGVTSNGSQNLSFNPTTFPFGTADCTMVLAGYMATSGTNACLFSYGANPPVAKQMKAIYNNTSNQMVFTDSNTNGAGTPAATWSGNDRLGIWRTTSSQSNWKIDVDGVENQPPVTVAAGSISKTSGFMFVWPDGAFIPAAGTIQQILIINRSLTLQEQRMIEWWESYKDGKNGTNLPLYHPGRITGRAPLISDVANLGAGNIKQIAAVSSLNGVTVSAAQAMSLQPVTFPYDAYQIQLVIPNFYIAGTIETLTGGTLTATASIENYETGVAQQITFGGNSSGSTSSAYLVSDLVILTDPKAIGTTHRVRIWVSSSNGILPMIAEARTPSDGTTAFGTTVADNTMDGGFPANTANGVFFSALVVAGRHNNPAVVAIGDSICHGYDGSGGGHHFAPNSGIFIPALSGTLACANYGSDGDSVSQFTGSTGGGVKGAIRAALANAYFTSCACNYGVNDMAAGGLTAAQVQTGMTAFVGMVTIPVHWSTITPVTLSSDGWSTPGSQSPTINLTQYTTANNYRRTLANFIETANAVQDGTNTEIWKSPGYTVDGTHPSPGGYAVAWGAVDPSTFT